MLAVFNVIKSLSHIFLVSILLLTASDGVCFFNDEAQFDTMTIFHESETKLESKGRFLLKAVNEQLLLDINYLNNHEEPYNEPVKIIIGYQWKDNNYARYGRNFDNGDEKQYCNFAEPEVVDRDKFAAEMGYDINEIKPDSPLGRPGDYLILPVFGHDDQTGNCSQLEYEVFSIEALIEKETIKNQ